MNKCIRIYILGIFQGIIEHLSGDSDRSFEIFVGQIKSFFYFCQLCYCMKFKVVSHIWI